MHSNENGDVEGGEEQETNSKANGETKLVLLKSATAPPTPPTSLVVFEEILGFGSHGTVVFKGSLQGRAVAVKHLLRDFVTLASREVSVLQESDGHPNVIRYCYQESHANFLYIAPKLCPASLTDVIEQPEQFRDIAITFDPKKALRQVTAGLRHLHGLKIIHRDIKPQNILVSHAKRGAGHQMLISDFGLCKKLELDQTSFYLMAHGAMAAGTIGWRAPEILRGDVSLDSTNSSGSSVVVMSLSHREGARTARMEGILPLLTLRLTCGGQYRRRSPASDGSGGGERDDEVQVGVEMRVVG
ncbi:kinase-like domain-containing protein [Irpex rosettiformis]|uniref:Kinase-like domain-containing protein n=1 Tax=Irpex rosettiformis TaxID=378272 RepID=A0ACB8TTV3_9APHY|nr:kinase-like domain-containing protein [Irpex rosettiformis]